MSNIPEEDLFKDSTMTFGEHLEELRGALLRSLVGLVIGVLIGLLVAKYVVRWIQTPLKDALDDHYEILAEEKLAERYGKDVPLAVKQRMKEEGLVFEEVLIERRELQRIADLPTTEAEVEDGSSASALEAPLPVPDADLVKTRIWRATDTVVRALSAQESFMIWLKAGMVAGLLIASPYILYQLWVFVAAGLYPHERRYVHIYLPMSLILFWSGAALAFFFAFEYILGFLFSFNRSLDIEADPRISEWIGFVLFLPLGFGIAFQLPLVMLFLHRIGIFTVQAYLEKWRIAILVIFVVAMFLTPADPMSMLLMAAPLTALYFLGIAMAHWMPRTRNPFRDAYEP
jgi:sec-independent protein translocase protein TatC